MIFVISGNGMHDCRGEHRWVLGGFFSFECLKVEKFDPINISGKGAWNEISTILLGLRGNF